MRLDRLIRRRHISPILGVMISIDGFAEPGVRLDPMLLELRREPDMQLP